MGSHSDQALDLAEESFIAVFSGYRHPDAGPPRKLVFESKESDGEKFEISLIHNSIAAFSVEANRRLKFYRLRRQENGERDFVYSLLTYTVSDSDLIPPV